MLDLLDVSEEEMTALRDVVNDVVDEILRASDSDIDSVASEDDDRDGLVVDGETLCEVKDSVIVRGNVVESDADKAEIVTDCDDDGATDNAIDCDADASAEKVVVCDVDAAHDTVLVESQKSVRGTMLLAASVTVACDKG